MTNKITALRPGRGGGKRINVFLDGKFAFSLDAKVVTDEGLHIADTLSEEQVAELANCDNFQRCLNAADRYLSFRPRSESELRVRLVQRGFNSQCVERVITNLKQRGLVDDVAFAQFWQSNRESFNPRSQWLTRLELRHKGVDNEVIDLVLETSDDGDSAYRAALSKTGIGACADYETFRRRVGGYLKRRGFSYGVINRTIERIWQEQEKSEVIK